MDKENRKIASGSSLKEGGIKSYYHFLSINLSQKKNIASRRVPRAKLDSSSAFLSKIFHSFHLGVPTDSGSYSLKILSKLMETTQHLNLEDRALHLQLPILYGLC